MQVIIANTKGGCGKTVLATQLASYYACAGRRVAIYDHDSQQSAMDWVKERPHQYSPITAVAAYAGDRLDSRADVAIHDMPAGYDIRDIYTDVPAADKLLIPVVPSPTDMRAAMRYFMALSHSGILDGQISVGFISNRSRCNISYNKIMNEFLSKLGIPIVGTIRDTQNYTHAMKRGLGIFDWPSKRTEVDRQGWYPIFNWLEQSPETSFTHEIMSQVSTSSPEFA